MKKQSPYLGRLLLVTILILLTGGVSNNALYGTNEGSHQNEKKKTSGIVVDEADITMPGVVVRIKNTEGGAITDIDGHFELEAEASDILVLSMIGYETLEVEVKKMPPKIKLVPKTDELNEVVVVGFAKQKKESVIGSISTLKPESLKIPASNLTQALGGSVAGIISYQQSGEPGADNAEFFIRGVTTFGYSKGPLILIDNIESSTDDLSRLSVDDIAAFSIMKDATATSIYGARGANGVMLITTKQGQEGKVKINARVETSLATPTRKIKMVDPISYMKYHNEAVTTRNPLAIRPHSDEKIASTSAGLNPYVYPAIDWYDDLFNDQVINTRANISMSGGGDIARYYVAAGVSNDKGSMKMDKRNNYNSNIDLQKIHVRSNINIDVTKTTEFAVRFNSNFDSYTGPIDSGNNLYRKALATSPVLFPKYYAPDEAHTFTQHILYGNAGTGDYINPYADMLRGYKEYDKTTISAQAELTQKLDFVTEGLNVRIFGSTTRDSFNEMYRTTVPFFYSLGYYDKQNDKYTIEGLNPEFGREDLDYVGGATNVSSSYYFEGSVNYNKTFSKVNNVTGLLVGVMRESKNSDAPTLQRSLPGRNLGVSGRFTYAYDSRYFLETNFGYNGSERFAKNERFGFFPSVGLAWLPSSEAFWGEGLNKTVNKLKLKATYGLVGNDNIGSADDRFYYMSEVLMNGLDAKYAWGEDFGTSPGMINIKRYKNEKIKWEIAKKLNVGAEIGLLNIFEFQVDYFTEKRTNIFGIRNTIPAEMGFAAGLASNTGEASSKGIEVQLDANHSINKNAWVGLRGNITYATSKYDSVEEPYRPHPWMSLVDKRINQPYGLVAERLFIDEEDIINSPTQTFGEYLPGDIKYRDVNNDGIINDEDVVPIGISSTPEVVFGFGASFGYKDWDVSCFFQGATRVSFFINSMATNPFMRMTDDPNEQVFGGRNNLNGMMQAYADDYWSETNRNSYAMFPRLSTQNISNNNRNSTWWLRDGSYLRLKSVELGYTLPVDLTKRLNISKLRVYLSGLNLIAWNKFKLWDAEQGNNGMQYPIQAVYNVGLNINF